ncbi:hypothetical protein [Halopiger thermotolerans]
MAVDTDDDSQPSRLERSGTASGRTTGILGRISSSYALKTAVAGLLVTVIGYVVNTGIWPAILGIWGIALVIVGAAIHVAVTLSRRGTRG